MKIKSQLKFHQDFYSLPFLDPGADFVNCPEIQWSQLIASPCGYDNFDSFVGNIISNSDPNNKYRTKILWKDNL